MTNLNHTYTHHLILVRHGKVDAPAGLYGQTDVSVTAQTNQMISQQILAKFACIQKVYTSPLSRCLSLASVLDSQCQHCGIVAIDSLQEMNFGDLDGVVFSDLTVDDSRWPTLNQFWHNPCENPLPNGEQLSDFNERVSHSFSEIVDSIMSSPIIDRSIINNHTALEHEQCANTSLVITHGGVIRVLIAHLLKLDWHNPALFSQLTIGNGSLTDIELTIDLSNRTLIGHRVNYIGAPIQ